MGRIMSAIASVPSPGSCHNSRPSIRKGVAVIMNTNQTSPSPRATQASSGARFRTSLLATGKPIIPVSAGHRKQAGITAGDQIEVQLQLDTQSCKVAVESERLETRLGPLAWRSSGRGPALVFFAGALANGDLWRDVVVALEDRYRCITIDLPLGAHPWPLSAGADRSATSLARLLLDCLELLEVEDATVVANDTAGGLLLLSRASGHPALGRVGR